MFCPHCGKEIAGDQAFCQYCGSRVVEPVSVAGRREKTPWEDRQNQGFLGGLLKTLKSSLFTPTEFFQKMPVTGGVAEPLIYSLIIGMAGTLFYYIWNISFQGMVSGYLPAEMKNMLGYEFFRGMDLALLAVVVPLAIISTLFIWSGILHLFLLLVKGAKHNFEATFRVVAYSYGTNIFNIIPVCGGIIAWVWSIVLMITGLKEAHETTGGKAAFAVLFPFLFCCGLAIVTALMVGVLAASITSSIHH